MTLPHPDTRGARQRGSRQAHRDRGPVQQHKKQVFNETHRDKGPVQQQEKRKRPQIKRPEPKLAQVLGHEMARKSAPGEIKTGDGTAQAPWGGGGRESVGVLAVGKQW